MPFHNNFVLFSDLFGAFSSNRLIPACPNDDIRNQKVRGSTETYLNTFAVRNPPNFHPYLLGH